MPRLDKETIARIKKLEFKELQDIVLKLASKEKSLYDYVFANYLDKEFGEKELFETTKADLEIIFRKRHKGFSEIASAVKKLRQKKKFQLNFQ